MGNTIITTLYVIGNGEEGIAETFHEIHHGKKQPVSTTDAYGKKIISEYMIIENGETAVTEVINITGLDMRERDKRTPFFGSSYDVGTVMLDTAAQDYRKIIIDLGESTTNDDGMGPLQALGCRFYNNSHEYLSPQAMNLDKIRCTNFNRPNKLEGIELTAVCGVKNHLLGESGTTYVFGKQKGFFPNQTRKADLGMENFRNQVRQYLHVGIDFFDGGGAAGGIGAVLIGILHANMIPGIKLLPSFGDMEEQVKDCDLVITGEGQGDRQTIFGKVSVGILKVASRHHGPCVCIGGVLGIGYQELYDLGSIGVYSIADRAMMLQQALDNVPDKLTATAYGVMKTVMYYMNCTNENKG